MVGDGCGEASASTVAMVVSVRKRPAMNQPALAAAIKSNAMAPTRPTSRVGRNRASPAGEGFRTGADAVTRGVGRGGGTTGRAGPVDLEGGAPCSEAAVRAAACGWGPRNQR